MSAKLKEVSNPISEASPYPFSPSTFGEGVYHTPNASGATLPGHTETPQPGGEATGSDLPPKPEPQAAEPAYQPRPGDIVARTSKSGARLVRRYDENLKLRPMSQAAVMEHYGVAHDQQGRRPKDAPAAGDNRDTKTGFAANYEAVKGAIGRKLGELATRWKHRKDEEAPNNDQSSTEEDAKGRESLRDRMRRWRAGRTAGQLAAAVLVESAYNTSGPHTYKEDPKSFRESFKAARDRARREADIQRNGTGTAMRGRTGQPPVSPRRPEREEEEQAEQDLGTQLLGPSATATAASAGTPPPRRETREEHRGRRWGVAAAAGVIAVGLLTLAAIEIADQGNGPEHQNPDHNASGPQKPGTDHPGKGGTNEKDQKGSEGKKKPSESKSDNKKKSPKQPRTHRVTHRAFTADGVTLRLIDQNGDHKPDKAVATLKAHDNVHGNIWNAGKDVLKAAGVNHPNLGEVAELKNDVLEQTKWNEHNAHFMPVGSKVVFDIHGKHVSAAHPSDKAA